MKGDFTRDTFDVGNFFNRVLMQQGRVTLDADFNEQVDILLHYMRMLARDLIGPYAAPSENPGFKLSPDGNGLLIGKGRYYVDGILVENKKACLYTEQPYYRINPDDGFLKIKEKNDQWFWLYLDVWERYLTSIEIDSIREPALGGPDTCARTQYVWQVKAMPIAPEDFEDYGYGRYPYSYNDYLDPTELCHVPLEKLVDVSKVQLAARVDPGKKNLDACITAPDSKYVGVENHLYRVEIHRGGSAGVATFKWSRDNGSVITPWLDTKSSEGNKSTDLTVTSTRGFSAGCWVELTDETDDLQERPGILVRVAKVGSGVLSLDSGSIPGGGLPDRTKLLHPKVRRWDQTEKDDIRLDGGAVPVVETPAANDAEQAKWIDLEDGIQIAFAQMPFAGGGKYRPGDYWLIPARVATGAIEWPSPDPVKKMSLVAPSGVVHHYAPLAFVGWEKNALKFHNCYCEFSPANSCFRRGRAIGGENLWVSRKATIMEVESGTIQAAPTASAPSMKAPPRKVGRKKPQ